MLGSSEAAGRFFVEILAEAGADDSALEEAARTVIARYRETRRAIPGYGHPLHKRREDAALMCWAHRADLGNERP